MWTERLRRSLAREDGFAVITAVVVASVMMLFTLGMLATGIHLTGATVRDRSWNTALQVAEAGLDHAVYEVGQDSAYAGTGGGVLTVPGGEVEVLVDRPADGEIVVYSTGWVPSRSATNALSRRIQVRFAPEDVFSYALFSSTGLFVKNTGGITGDVFANEGVEVDNNSDIEGSVISATEGVTIGNSSVISGDVYSGGSSGIVINNTAIVEGNANAQSTSCSGSPGPGAYSIAANGTVMGDAVAWGTISGNVVGSRTPANCQLALATRSLPGYTWDGSLFTGEVEYDSISAFQTWADANLGSLSGVHRVWVDDCAADPDGTDNLIELGGATVSTDFTLVTNCRLDLSNSFAITAPTSAIVDMIILNDSTDPPAVQIKNNFEVAPNDPAVLLYSSGLIQIKNSAESNGAVYAGAISIKNSLDVVYDPRVERTLGFGDVKYDRQAWIECTVGTTGTDC